MLRKNKYSLLQTKTAVTSLYSLQASTRMHTTTPTSKQPKNLDQYQYLSNYTTTPPLTKQQSTDNKLGLMLGWGGVSVYLVKC